MKVLRSMRPLQLEDVVIGQYKGHSKGLKSHPGYTDDPTVPKDSITPTFAALALFINNARWDGVPFLMKAGKALHTKGYVDCRIPNIDFSKFMSHLGGSNVELSITIDPHSCSYGNPEQRSGFSSDTFLAICTKITSELIWTKQQMS